MLHTPPFAAAMWRGEVQAGVRVTTTTNAIIVVFTQAVERLIETICVLFWV